MNPSRISVQELLRHPINVLALATIVALAAVCLAPWVVAAGVGAEIVYLTAALILASRRTVVRQFRSEENAASAQRSETAPITTAPLAHSAPKSPRMEQAESLGRLLALRIQTVEIQSPDLLGHLQYLTEYTAEFEVAEQKYLEEAEQIRLELDRRRASDEQRENAKILHAPLGEGVDFRYALPNGEAHASASGGSAATVASILRQIVQALEDNNWTRSQNTLQADDWEDYTSWLIARKARLLWIKNAVQDLHFRQDMILTRLTLTAQELGVVSLKQILADNDAVLVQCRSLARHLSASAPK